MKRLGAILLIIVALLLPSTAQCMRATKTEILIARVIWAEARGESMRGKIAVANVILNRAKWKTNYKSVSKVVYKKHAFVVGRKYDKSCLLAARYALNGKRVIPKSVKYFKATYSRARWNPKGYWGTIGTHRFYKFITWGKR